MIIRPIARTDLAAWTPLWEGYNSFYERPDPASYADVTRATWGRFFDAYEPVNALVAEEGGALLGLVHYIFHRSTTMVGPTCYLQDLFTTPASRGKGVGRALIKGVYEKAREGGAGRVYWLTHKTNTAGMALYDKVAEASGFVQYRKFF